MRSADAATSATKTSERARREERMSLPRHPSVELVSSRTLHHGRIFDIVHEVLRLPSGLMQELDIVDHGGAVGVAALDRAGRLLLVRQYRHAAGDWLVEIPAGRVEAGEARLAAAQRELEEETGQRAGRWELLREFFPAPGFCSERISVWLAQDLEPVVRERKAMDADEELECVWLTPAEVLAHSSDAKSLIAAALILARGG